MSVSVRAGLDAASMAGHGSRRNSSMRARDNRASPAAARWTDAGTRHG